MQQQSLRFHHLGYHDLISCATLRGVHLDRPLSDAEIDELDDFLQSADVPEGCMGISMLHGFLTAVAIGPSLVLPSEWMPVIWGDEAGPLFDSAADAQHISSLILRSYNSILHTLQNAPDEFLPILFEEETAQGTTEWRPEDWCRGFIEGTYLRKEDWLALFEDAQNVTVLAPILAFLDDETMKEIQASAKKTQPTREMLMDFIPLSVAAIYEYWLERRKPHSPGLTLDRTRLGRPRIGRNDPCPCGSSKKFKKCCGAE